jgi:hypothetical protein
MAARRQTAAPGRRAWARPAGGSCRQSSRAAVRARRPPAGCCWPPTRRSCRWGAGWAPPGCSRRPSGQSPCPDEEGGGFNSQTETICTAVFASSLATRCGGAGWPWLRSLLATGGSPLAAGSVWPGHHAAAGAAAQLLVAGGASAQRCVPRQSCQRSRTSTLWPCSISGPPAVMPISPAMNAATWYRHQPGGCTGQIAPSWPWWLKAAGPRPACTRPCALTRCARCRWLTWPPWRMPTRVRTTAC